MIVAANLYNHDWMPGFRLTSQNIAIFDSQGKADLLHALKVIELGVPDFVLIAEKPEGARHAKARLLMRNKTLDDQCPDYVAYVNMPSIYRVPRSLRHAGAKDLVTAKDLDQVHASLGREIMWTRLITAEDLTGHAEYEQRIERLYRLVFRRLSKSKKLDDVRLLEKLQRAGNLHDSKGRLNPCAIPLVIRLCERLLGKRAFQRRMRGDESMSMATGWREAIRRLEAITEQQASQLMAFVRSPCISPERWNEATPSLRKRYIKNLLNLTEDTLPNIITALTQWLAPEPFGSVWRAAEDEVFLARDAVDEAIRHLAMNHIDNANRAMIRASRHATRAAQTLARLQVLAVLEDVLLPLATRTVHTDSSELQTWMQQTEPLISESLYNLQNVYTRGVESEDFMWFMNWVFSLFTLVKICADSQNFDLAYTELRSAELRLTSIEPK